MRRLMLVGRSSSTAPCTSTVRCRASSISVLGESTILVRVSAVSDEEDMSALDI